MAIKKLAIRFADELLSEPLVVENVLARFDTAWTNPAELSMSVGETLTLSCSESFHDYQRTQMVLVVGGRVKCQDSNLTVAAGDCFLVQQWQAETIVAETQTQLIMARTCAATRFFQKVELFEGKPFRKEAAPSQRLASAGDVLELLQAFQTGMNGTPQMVFSLLCDDFVGTWRAKYYENISPKSKVDDLVRLTDDFLEKSRQALFGHELINSQAAHQVLESWLRKEFDFSSLTLEIAPSVASTNLRASLALFEAPVFIVAAPRSGSTMLFEALKENREFWTIGDESHQVFESINELHPAAREFNSNRLLAEHLNADIGSAVVGGVIRRLRDAQGTLFSGLSVDEQPTTIRFLEKTPKNALRIPFLKALFPTAKFIFLHRRPEPNIASIIEAWQSGKFVTYPNLPDWRGLPWSLLLCEGWQTYVDRPTADVAAWQWASTNQQILNDLNALDRDDWGLMSYESLLSDPEKSLDALCGFANVPFGPRMRALANRALPESKYTLDKPFAEKWRKHAEALNAAFVNVPMVEEVRDQLEVIVSLSNDD